MLYGIEEDADSAYLSCRKCDYKQEISKENPVVYDHVLREDKTTRHIMNPYLKFDPTLAHLDNIICPNTDCTSRKSGKSDIVPVKINEKNLVWMYQCVVCGNTWKQKSRAS
jgi:DNA-directed RNA polymerase subunit M/transcription elongation factor TFIIS